jgi:hypothetical protein
MTGDDGFAVVGHERLARVIQDEMWLHVGANGVCYNDQALKWAANAD